MPPLATLAGPLLTPTLLLTLTVSLVRLDWSAVPGWRRRPWLVSALVAFILGVSPLLVWAVTTPAVAAGLSPALREAHAPCSQSSAE